MRYIGRRLIFYVIALWASVTFNFAIPRAMPGDPAEAIYAANHQALQNDPNALHAIQVELGLSNDPMIVQYWHYIVNLAHGNLGTSFTTMAPVSQIIRDALPWTLFLVGLASVIAFVIGTLAGIYCSWRRGGLADGILVPATAVFSAFPPFFLALLLAYYVGIVAGWLPYGSAYDTGSVPNLSLDFIGQMLHHAILPALTIVVAALGGWLIGMRNAMINTLAEDYVTMATAKGLTDRRVMLRYAARNAILPQVTGFAMSLGFVVGGQVFIEYVFNYPGIGFQLVNGVGQEDYPLIQGILLIITVCVLLANLAADLVYARLDPRVRRS
jgi:peptide/nickel transport system permease protein